MKAPTLLFAIAGLCAAGAQAECDQPPLVVIPAGELTEAAEAEIDEATRQYFQAMQDYVACIRAELDPVVDYASELFVEVLVRRNNAAVREAEAVQRWYNSRFSGDENESAEPEAAE